MWQSPKDENIFPPPRISSLIVGIGLGGYRRAPRCPIGEKVLERESKSLNYLKEPGQRLREGIKEAVRKGRGLIGRQCHESMKFTPECERAGL
jgi:hypothetical protein